MGLDIGQLISARDHLDNARDSVRLLENPQRIEDVLRGFSSFVASMRTFYSHPLQACKQSTETQRWYDHIKQENNNDELMYYFSQARDQTAHGKPAPLYYSVKGNLKAGSISIFSRLGIVADMSPDLTSPHVKYTFVLESFTNARSGKFIKVPTKHFDQVLSSDDAIEATRMVLTRMQQTFDVAWAMFHLD